MNFKIPPQAMFFYRGKWTQEMDAMLLSTLITLRSGRQWDEANLPDEVLRIVRAVLNHPFGVHLATDDIAVRVNLLKARYRRFKKLVKTDGVQWNTNDRIVSATDSTWKDIFQRDASTATYYYRDEPDFSLLASYFGLYDVKDEFPQEVITISDNSKEVILLSDSDVPNAPIRSKPNLSPPDTDEVTSPMPPATTYVRRKLFDVQVLSFPELGSPSSPPRVNTVKSSIFSSPQGSSSASWSPSSKPR